MNSKLILKLFQLSSIHLLWIEIDNICIYYHDSEQLVLRFLHYHYIACTVVNVGYSILSCIVIVSCMQTNSTVDCSVCTSSGVACTN